MLEWLQELTGMGHRKSVSENRNGDCLKVKWVAGLLGLVMTLGFCWGLGMTTAAPAWAATNCRKTNGHEVCIQRMKRSAKNYWQYKAKLRVDGVQRPMELYDCRDRLRLPKDGTIIPYWQDDAVDVVCTLFRKRELMRQPMPKNLGK